MKKIYYVSLIAMLLGGCTVYPSRGYLNYSTQYNPPTPYIINPNTINSTVIINPYYPMPIPGCIWKFSPIFGWSWYHPNYGWYNRREGWRHEDHRIENTHPFLYPNGMERGQYRIHDHDQH